MRNLLFYCVIFTTGLCSLGYQVLWQRYLSVFVGSEARSTTIIIAVFLMGLAIGYYVFGRLCEKVTHRKTLLKYYGFVELATGAYCLIFNYYFDFFHNTAWLQSSNFLVHIFLTMLMLLFPTILMGATVPVMTTVIPNNQEEVNRTHSLVYGVNTIGAFLGVLLTGFVIVPALGFELSLKLLGFINILVSFIYIGNNLEGSATDKQDMPAVTNEFDEKLVFGFAFLVGAISISLEVLWIRLWSMTIGSAHLIFPVILSIFILAIGSGSLFLKETNIKNFKKSLVGMVVFNSMAFFIAPYLPIITSNIRVMLVSHEASYYAFNLINYFLLLIVIVPGAFFLGRMLPFTYAMINKSKENYGYKCGLIYFLNTIGTFIGSTVLGYLVFYVFNIPTIYKINLFILFGFSCYFLYKLNSKKSLAIVGVVSFALLIFSFPRKYHYLGLFRVREAKPFHFQNIFEVTHSKPGKFDYLFLEDGPNTTVSVLKERAFKDKLFQVNGKTDGNTVMDYGTMGLAALLPYSMTSKADLNVSIIGVGTGVTAGVAIDLKRIKEIDLIEISQAALDAQKHLSPENGSYYDSPKVKMHSMDAFQFYKANEKKYDLIISEPSNPWVIGTENLFTKYFYQVIDKRLEQDGILFQWFHTYSSNNKSVVSILANLKAIFPVVEIYRTQHGDIGILASRKPLNLKEGASKEEKVLTEIGKMKLGSFSNLKLLKLYSDREVNAIIKTNPRYQHEIFDPKLSLHGYKNFFLGNNVKMHTLMDPFLARHLHSAQDYEEKKNGLSEISKMDCKEKDNVEYLDVGCSALVDSFGKHVANWLGDNLPKKLSAYSVLRKEKFLQKNSSFLKYMEGHLKNEKKIPALLRAKLSQNLLNELTKDGSFEEAMEFATWCVENRLLAPITVEQLKRRIQGLKQVLGKI